MCVPDLLGTQGTFLLFTTRPGERQVRRRAVSASRSNARATASTRRIQGPDNMFVDGNPPLTIPMTHDDRSRGAAACSVTHRRHDGRSAAGRVERLDHADVQGRAGRQDRRDRALQVLEMDEHFSLYVSPINLDPDHPGDADLASVATTRPTWQSGSGRTRRSDLAEDTWALNESVIERRHVPAAGLRHRSRAPDDVLLGARSAAARNAGLRVRCHRPDSAHVLAVSRGRPSRARAVEIPASTTRRDSRALHSATTRWSAR